MKSRIVLMVGCGDIGVRVGKQLVAQQHRVVAVRRTISELPSTFEAISADYSEPGSLNFAEQLAPSVIIATFNPSERSPEGYRRGFTEAAHNLLMGLGAHKPDRIVFVSSTRVYAEKEGGWVDEASARSTDDPRAVAIVDAENALLASGHAASVVRFAGIYGKPNGRLLSRIRGGQIAPLYHHNRP